MYKAVIFDFFGVIHRDPFEHWLKQNDIERTGEIHESARQFDLGNISLGEHYRRVSSRTGKPARSIRTSFEDISFIDHEMIGLIKRLKKNYKTGLLSNSGTEYIDKILEKYDLKPLFDTLIISSEVGMIKPEPEIFRHALSELDAATSEAIFIDDNPRNTEAATALGIKSFLYEGDVSDLAQELEWSGLTI